MEKISITIDVGKIDKNKIISRSFQTKDGKTVTVKEVKLDVVPVKEPKLIKDGDTWQMWKTHFVAEPSTKEEVANGAKSKILGDGIVFKNKSLPELPVIEDDGLTSEGVDGEQIDPASIPF